jgi:hypothetical protein
MRWVEVDRIEQLSGEVQPSAVPTWRDFARGVVSSL